MELAVECLYRARRSVDEQESSDRNLFLAYFEGKDSEAGEEDRPPMDD